MSVWVYRAQEWYVRDADGPHVHHEAEVCQFDPVVVADFSKVSDGVAKIVGVSEDLDAMAHAKSSIQELVGVRVSATNSQSYYLDITNPQANKGVVVDYLSMKLDIPVDAIAAIGDAYNDVPMFERSGLSIAMGNAEDDVKAAATHVTTSNEDEGFARAVETFILLSLTMEAASIEVLSTRRFQFTTRMHASNTTRVRNVHNQNEWRTHPPL